MIAWLFEYISVYLLFYYDNLTISRSMLIKTSYDCNHINVPEVIQLRIKLDQS